MCLFYEEEQQQVEDCGVGNNAKADLSMNRILNYIYCDMSQLFIFDRHSFHHLPLLHPSFAPPLSHHVNRNLLTHQRILQSLNSLLNTLHDRRHGGRPLPQYLVAGTTTAHSTSNTLLRLSEHQNHRLHGIAHFAPLRRAAQQCAFLRERGDGELDVIAQPDSHAAGLHVRHRGIFADLGPFIQLVLDQRASLFPNREVGLRLLRISESEGFAGREGGLRLGELVGQLLVCGDEGSDVGCLYR